MFKGITEGIIASRANDADDDPGLCVIRGAAFPGFNDTLTRQHAAGTGHSVKLLMVHGIGKHLPGYSGRLQDNLTTALGLTVEQSKPKQFTLLPPPARVVDLGDAPNGTLRIYRYTNQDESRELLFYELTWSDIVEPKKSILAYDESEEYAYRRANLNRLMKSFFNSHIPDPVIYTGDIRQYILASVTQSLCWMYAGDWDDLPDGGRQRCDVLNVELPRQINEDEIAIVTHSLGSRIAMDALQYMASLEELLRSEANTLATALQQKRIPIYMLANQLPLLQLGFVTPSVTDAIPLYCRVEGEHYAQRLFDRLRIIAFSDPNDILSYGLPPEFTEQYIDSRLCPEVVNVVLNVAPIQSIPVIGEFANPRAAHSNYEADARVIDLMVNGLDSNQPSQLVQQQCRWTETRD
jgi:hypothetical protein